MLSRLRRTDDGLALTVVLGTTAVLTLFVLLSLEVTVQGVQRARQDQSYLDAMPAAQAGVEDYLHRLNRDNNYFRIENTDSSNPAFTRWVHVPGMPTDAAFRYQMRSTADEAFRRGRSGCGHGGVRADECGPPTSSSASAGSSTICTSQTRRPRTPRDTPTSA